MSDPLQELCLQEELRNATQLIKSGLGNLQEIDMGDDFYHLPHQLLASGIERLLKCYICLVYEARNGNYPDFKFVKDLGHDIVELKEAIIQGYYNTDNRPRLQQDLDFITNDADLSTMIHILSEFGKFARYYNLDVVTGSTKVGIDPTAEWQKLESSLEDITPYLAPGMQEALHQDYYPRVQRKISAKVEQFLRAICSQFTMGNHGGKLGQYSPFVMEFITRMDSQFGDTDYRRSTKVLLRGMGEWNRRSEEEIAASPWPKRRVSRSDFQGEWPFTEDEVVLERREKHCYIVSIDGYDFSLNGLAASRYKYLYPHDAGLAVIGKSVGPFIDMAKALQE